MLPLEGYRALITGASAGIGLASAHAIAALGASIVLAARTQAPLENACNALPTPSAGQKHSWLILDMADPNVAEKFVDAELLSHASGDPISILINNSGGPAPGPIHAATPSDFISTFQQQLLGAHALVQALLPGMRERRFGRIVNVISTSVKEPLKDLGVSNTVRAAVASWAKTLAGELGSSGITVNNVLPGYTRTARLEQIIVSRMQKLGKTRLEVEQAMLGDVPANRFAEPEEVAAAIAFLSSPQAAYINGINLPVDGGRTRSL